MAGQESKAQPHVPYHTQRSESTDKGVQKKAQEKAVKQRRLDFALTFGPKEGRNVLRWIMSQAGYHRSSVGGNPSLGMDVLQGTLYNESRKSLYMELREYIPEEVLKDVEFNKLEGDLI